MLLENILRYTLHSIVFVCIEVVVSDTDGSMEMVELNPPDPWTLDPREAQDLQPGELAVK